MKKRLHRFLKALATYEIWQIYSIETVRCREPDRGLTMGAMDSLAQMENPSVPEEVRRANCSREGALAYAAWKNGAIAGVCWLWPGPLLDKRSIGAQPGDSAEIIQITVGESFRGMGIAPALILYSGCRLRELGYRRLYAQIWHSNAASVRAFQKCGWEKVAWFVQLRPRFLPRPLRFRKLLPPFRDQPGLLENWKKARPPLTNNIC